MVSQMIKSIIPQLKTFQVALLCDSWYTEGAATDTIKEFKNLEIGGSTI